MKGVKESRDSGMGGLSYPPKNLWFETDGWQSGLMYLTRNQE